MTPGRHYYEQRVTNMGSIASLRDSLDYFSSCLDETSGSENFWTPLVVYNYLTMIFILNHLASNKYILHCFWQIKITTFVSYS